MVVLHIFYGRAIVRVQHVYRSIAYEMLMLAARYNAAPHLTEAMIPQFTTTKGFVPANFMSCVVLSLVACHAYFVRVLQALFGVLDSIWLPVPYDNNLQLFARRKMQTAFEVRTFVVFHQLNVCIIVFIVWVSRCAPEVAFNTAVLLKSFCCVPFLSVWVEYA